MATLAFDRAQVSRAVFFDGGPYAPLNVRGRFVAQSVTDELTLTGDPNPGDAITLTKVGGAAWLSAPATCDHGVAFTLTLDCSALAAGDYHEVLRASHAGYDDADLAIHLAVRPGQ